MAIRYATKPGSNQALLQRSLVQRPKSRIDRRKVIREVVLPFAKANVVEEPARKKKALAPSVADAFNPVTGASALVGDGQDVDLRIVNHVDDLEGKAPQVGFADLCWSYWRKGVWAFADPHHEGFEFRQIVCTQSRQTTFIKSDLIQVL